MGSEDMRRKANPIPNPEARRTGGFTNYWMRPHQSLVKGWLELWLQGARLKPLPIREVLRLIKFPIMVISSVIKSFADAETAKVFHLVPSRKLPDEIQHRAKVKLDQLHAASELNHLRIPPSNRLEKLSGNLKNFHSIRINQQWRIVFLWQDQHAHQVAITDYH